MKPLDKTGFKKSELGMSLIEVLIVLSIIALLFGLALPRLQSSKKQIKLTFDRLRSDLKASANMAVVSGKAHRMIIDLKSNKYWVETTENRNLSFAELKGLNDEKNISKEEKEKQKKEELKKYTDLVGEKVKDDEGNELPLASPVITQLEKKTDLGWSMADGWRKKDFSNHLIISDIKTESSPKPFRLEEISDNKPSWVSILLMPSGTVERFIIHFYHRAGSQIDKKKKPYTFYLESKHNIGFESGLLNFDDDYKLK